jgi:tetratricopeptide (TPR) repeat protein
MWERHNVAGQQALSQGKPVEAESQFKLALAEAEKLGTYSAPVAQVLLNLANTYRQQGKYVEAEPAYKRALEVKERNTGPLHKETVPFLENYSKMLRAAGRTDEAEKLDKKAIAIFSKN